MGKLWLTERRGMDQGAPAEELLVAEHGDLKGMRPAVRLRERHPLTRTPGIGVRLPVRLARPALGRLALEKALDNLGQQGLVCAHPGSVLERLYEWGRSVDNLGLTQSCDRSN